MTAPSGVTGPDLATCPLVAVPTSASIDQLALAWYPEARWIRAPVTAEVAASRTAPLRGARFRGMVVVADPEPGELELEPGVVLVGPVRLAQDRSLALGLNPDRVDVFALRVGGADATHREKRAATAARWMVAAARHSRGVVVDAGAVAARVLTPGRVDRRLFSAHALDPVHALALVRTVLVQAVLATVGPEPTGPRNFEIVTRTPYDGSVVVRCERADRLPPALRTVPWRDSGPFGYTVQWIAEDGDDRSERPSQIHQIARQRMAPVVIQIVAVLRHAIAGTVVDDDGFICSDVPGRSV